MAREERELTDARWAVLKPPLPPQRPTTGRPNKDHAKSWKRSCGCCAQARRGGPARLLRSLADGRQPLLPLTSPGCVRLAAGRNHPPRRHPWRAGLAGALGGRQLGSAGRPGRGRPCKRPERLAADKGYSYPSVRAEVRRPGIGAVIPTRSNQRVAYADRNRVERCVNRLKQFRRVATRDASAGATTWSWSSSPRRSSGCDLRLAGVARGQVPLVRPGRASGVQQAFAGQHRADHEH
jgi:transposase